MSNSFSLAFSGLLARSPGLAATPTPNGGCSAPSSASTASGQRPRSPLFREAEGTASAPRTSPAHAPAGDRDDDDAEAVRRAGLLFRCPSASRSRSSLWPTSRTNRSLPPGPRHRKAHERCDHSGGLEVTGQAGLASQTTLLRRIGGSVPFSKRVLSRR